MIESTEERKEREILVIIKWNRERIDHFRNKNSSADMSSESRVEEGFCALEIAVKLDTDESGSNDNVGEVIKHYSRAVSLFEAAIKDKGNHDKSVANLLSDKVQEFKARIDELYARLPSAPSVEMVEDLDDIPIANLVLEGERDGLAEGKEEVRGSALSSLEEYDTKELDRRQEQRIEQRKVSVCVGRSVSGGRERKGERSRIRRSFSDPTTYRTFIHPRATAYSRILWLILAPAALLNLFTTIPSSSWATRLPQHFHLHWVWTRSCQSPHPGCPRIRPSSKF